MATRIDVKLLPELKEYGRINLEECFNCGNCTAVCPLTSDDYPFPRKMIRLVQIGDAERLQESLDPWLCYYCGDCSETCPKGAEPAEGMMSIRRWLTAQYDWTGLARKFYTSVVWEVGSMVLLGALVVLLFVIFHGPMVTNQVELNTFAPVGNVHLGDWIMAAGLLFFIGANVLSMYRHVMQSGDRNKIPLSLYFTEAWHLVYHFATQKRWTDCEDIEYEHGKREQRMSWLAHVLLVSGYVLMLVLIIFFLRWFQTDEIYPLWHPQRWLGYYATIVLLYGAGRAIWGRLQKNIQMHRFSHPSDWIFPILLAVVTLTGIFQHTFRYLGWALPTYYTYVIHLAFAVPMLVLEVPFGKWSHLYYRPLAIYFERVKVNARQIEDQAAGALAPAD
jgi:heterodisulfide reductase subunit C